MHFTGKNIFSGARYCSLIKDECMSQFHIRIINIRYYNSVVIKVDLKNDNRKNLVSSKIWLSLTNESMSTMTAR